MELQKILTNVSTSQVVDMLKLEKTKNKLGNLLAIALLTGLIISSYFLFAQHETSCGGLQNTSQSLLVKNKIELFFSFSVSCVLSVVKNN
jgi:hypothetical protein